MRLILFLLLTVASVIIGIAVAKDPGYLLIVYRKTSVEMPLWLGILGTLLGMYAVYLIAYIVRSIVAVPGEFKHWVQHGRMHRMRRRTVRGYIALLEGNWREAEQLLVKSSHRWHTAVINYLCAAAAAEKQGKTAERDEYLRKAHQIDSRADLAIGITQARLQMDNGQWEQSLATLQRMHQLSPDHDFILELLQQVLIQLKDWPSLLDLLPVLKKKKLVTETQFTALSRTAYSGLLMQANSVDAKKAAWDKIPATFRLNADVLSLYLPILLEENDLATAESLLRDSLNHTWDERLVRYYGRVHTSDIDKQIKTAEHWQKKHADDPMLLLAIARFYAIKSIWGQAVELLNQSLRIKSDPETYWVLGHVYDNMHDPEQAKLNYEMGLQVAVRL
ncbi:MAG: heme biosynthesis HemY N-terminal domain-containing protein [Gammaproteobacteria bacterium]